MTEAGIGRVLVASLHQGISDLLPTRLEFYENWLNPDGMRTGTVGPAQVQAVLSFLRREGEHYGQITSRAGEYAAEWVFASQPAVRRAVVRATPLRLRSRLALALARRTIRRTASGCRAGGRFRKGHVRLDISGSVFCDVRDPSARRLCGFHLALVSRLLALHNVPAAVEPGGCRAVGDPSCLIEVTIDAHRRPFAAGLATSR